MHGVFPCSWEECRIFTASSISLSQSWRQWRSRYTIHAGRNLPAKEFRYLRTVRVTAAVYLYLNFARERSTFMDRHRAGLRPNTSFLNFAESCVFTKQSLPPFSWYHSNSIERSSFFQSYRVNLQSSFKIVISITLVFSTNLLVSVSSTVQKKLFSNSIFQWLLIFSRFKSHFLQSNVNLFF